MPMLAIANGQQDTKDEIIYACWQSPNRSGPIESEVADQDVRFSIGMHGPGPRNSGIRERRRSAERFDYFHFGL